MANYIVSFEFSGPRLTDQDMDQHMGKAGWVRRKILESAWYVSADESTSDVFNRLQKTLSPNDRLIVVNAAEALWRNLLIPDASLQVAFHSSG